MTQAYLKELIRQSFDCTKYLKKSKGNDMFCCPACGSGYGPNGTGAVHYYTDSRRWYCHRCRTLGDIFTIYELEHGVDFNAALRALAEQLGTAVEPYSTKPARKCPPALAPMQSGSAPKDLSDYFAECRARLHDPAAVSFLSGNRCQDSSVLRPWFRSPCRSGRKSPLLRAYHYPDESFPLRCKIH